MSNNKSKNIDYFNNSRVAIIHDFILYDGGAERNLTKLVQLFKNVEVFTLYLDPNPQTEYIKSRLVNNQNQAVTIHQTLPHWLPAKKQLFRFYKLLEPIITENINLEQYDLVLSHTARFSKGMITSLDTKNVFIVLTPCRSIWHLASARPKLPRMLREPLYHVLRLWDSIAMRRADLILAISTDIQRKIKKFYGLKSEVLHPIVDTELILQTLAQAEESSATVALFNEVVGYRDNSYYLTLHRLDYYKHTRLAINTFGHRRSENLIVVGDGEEFNNLVTLATKLTKQTPNIKVIKRTTITAVGNIIFIQGASDQLSLLLLKHAQALINTNREDFGLCMADALTVGTPVIAYHRGGARDIVIDNKTGVLFTHQRVNSLNQAIIKLDKLYQQQGQEYLSKQYQQQVEQFNVEHFQAKIKTILNTND